MNLLANVTGDLHNNLSALKAVEGFLAGQDDGDIDIQPSQLYFLINLITTEQEKLIKKLENISDAIS